MVGFGVMPYLRWTPTPPARRRPRLAYRFGIAAVLTWGFLAVTGRLTRPVAAAARGGHRPGAGVRGDVGDVLRPGPTLPPALTGLLLYAYPALVALTTGVLARRAPSRRVLMALALSVAGILLTVAPGQLEPRPAGGARVRVRAGRAGHLHRLHVFSGYHAADLPACCADRGGHPGRRGGAEHHGRQHRGLQVPPPVDAWRPVLLVAVVSTVLAISAFLGVGPIGPTRPASSAPSSRSRTCWSASCSTATLLSALPGTGLVLGGAVLAALAGRVPGAHDPHVPGAEAA